MNELAGEKGFRVSQQSVEGADSIAPGYRVIARRFQKL